MHVFTNETAAKGFAFNFRVHVKQGLSGVGGSRYSLTEHDQTEIMAQLTAVKEGAAAGGTDAL